MHEARHNFYVGLFVLFGLVAFAALVVMFSRQAVWRVQEPAFTLKARFDNAAGIRQGRQVTVGGIEVGRVTSVGFADPDNYQLGVLVELAFDRPPNFRSGTVAQTSEPGLGQGRPPIVIVPGPTDRLPLTDGAEIPGQIRSAMESLIPPDVVEPFKDAAERIGQITEKLDPLLDSLLAMFEQRTPAEVDAPGGPEGNLSSAATRLDGTFRSLNEILADQQSRDRLAATIDNLYAMSNEARTAVSDIKAAAADLRGVAPRTNEVLDTAQQKVVELDARIDEVADRVLGNLDQISGVLRSAQVFATRLERGEGSLGKLTTDSRLYEAAVLTVQRLSAAIDELNLLLQEWQKGRIKVAL